MDLLIVADPADYLAALLASEARKKGAVAMVMEHGPAARLFTVLGGRGGACVEPDVPMLLRPRLRPLSDRSADARFLSGEANAALWAAAALARSPVVNRPDRFGFEGRWSPSGATLERRASLRAGTELHARPISPMLRPNGPPWAAEEASGRVRRWLTVRPRGQPFRARPLLKDERYEEVVVLADRVWRTGSAGPAAEGLARRSIEVARRLGLTFAVVTWGVAKSPDTKRLARVDPYPRPDQLLGLWPEVAPALLATLGC